MTTSDTKRIYVVNNGQPFIWTQEEVVYQDGKIQKDSDNVEIKDVAPYVKGFYDIFFKQYFDNIAILAAAGTSLDNGKNKGMIRSDLWGFCKPELEAVAGHIDGIKAKSFWVNKDIEALLSFLTLYNRVSEGSLDKDLEAIKLKIKSACTLELDEASAPHTEFLKKITARKANSPRVQLFTTNYDTLFEQAARRLGFVIIDGFSFSQPRIFSGRNFDFDIVKREKTRIKNEESFIANVLHIYKLHGSLDWERIDDTIMQREIATVKSPLIIYPASDKYESSYEQPYFEMMSRFQQMLRKDNLLILVAGFGFQDKHIQNVIIEAVNQNSSSHLVILDYSGENRGIDIERYSRIFSGLKPNMTIISGKFSDFARNYPCNATYVISEKYDAKSF